MQKTTRYEFPYPPKNFWKVFNMELLSKLYTQKKIPEYVIILCGICTKCVTTKGWDYPWCLLYFINCISPHLRWSFKNLSIDSLYCSSPRKSLVKGERFIRGMKRNQSEEYQIFCGFIFTHSSHNLVISQWRDKISLNFQNYRQL